MFTLVTETRLHMRRRIRRLQTRQQIGQSQQVDHPEGAASVRYRQEWVRLRKIRPPRRHVPQVIELVTEHDPLVIRALRDHGGDCVQTTFQGMKRMRDHEPSPFRSARRRSLISTPSARPRSPTRSSTASCTTPIASSSRASPSASATSRHRSTAPTLSPPSGDDVDASCGPSAVLRNVWTRRGQVRGTCPPLAHTRRSRDHILTASTTGSGSTCTGAFGAIASARTGGRAAAYLARCSPPRPIPNCTVTRARLRSQPAGRWPAPSSTRGETTPQTREREAPPRPVRAGRNRGQITQESRSSVPGIAVKCAGIRSVGCPHVLEPALAACFRAPKSGHEPLGDYRIEHAKVIHIRAGPGTHAPGRGRGPPVRRNRPSRAEALPQECRIARIIPLFTPY